MSCKHSTTRCLNQYDTFRKYLCEDCGKVFMCECERELALTFLPHQTHFGSEYGTNKRYPVSGFEVEICSECKDKKEKSFPLFYGGKIERYYWREIYKTYSQMVLDYSRDNNISIKDILHIKGKYQSEAKLMKKKAKSIWQKKHRTNPKYVIKKEKTEKAFLSEVQVPQRNINATYMQTKSHNRKKEKNWVDESGKAVRVEEIAAQYYRKEGFDVWFCELRLISILVAVFCTAIKDSSITNSAITRDSISQDFGGPDYYHKREKKISELISKIRANAYLSQFFEDFLEPSKPIRRYLGVEDNYTVEFMRAAVDMIPSRYIADFINWAIQHFWDRRSGWPDLLLLKRKEFRFAEVKAPRDKLRRQQMKWFKWAIEEANVPCEICNVNYNNS